MEKLSNEKQSMTLVEIFFKLCFNCVCIEG